MKKIKNKVLDKQERYLRRKHRTNTLSKINWELPRLIVNKSNKFTYAQIIDLEWNVVSAANDVKVKWGTKTERATNVGLEVAKKALEKWVEKISFDRNWNLYIWRVKALADWARQAWLKF